MPQPASLQRATALALLLALYGCAGDDDASGMGPGEGANPRPDVGDLGPQLEGIYELTEHLTNLDACDLGGLVTAGHTFLALYVTSFQALSKADVISCASIEECRASVMAARSGERYLVNFHFAFDEQATDTDTSLLGHETVTVQAGEQCHRMVTDAVLEQPVDGQIRVEARIWLGADYPIGTAENCDSDEGPEPDLNAPCTRLETLTAELVDELAIP